MSLLTRQGLRFNGLTDYVSVPDSSILSPNNTITLESYVKTPGGTRQDTLYRYNGTYGYILRVCWEGGNRNAGSTFMIYVGGALHSVNSNIPIDDNTWHLITGVYDGSRVLIYVDGILANQSPVTGVITNATGSTLYIGSAGNKYLGGMGVNRIYNRALYPEEVAANYRGEVTRAGLVGEWLLNEGTGITAHDTSGYGNHGTITGATWSEQQKQRQLSKVKPKKNLFDPVSYIQHLPLGDSLYDSTRGVLTNYNPSTGAVDCPIITLEPNTSYTFSVQAITSNVRLQMYDPDTLSSVIDSGYRTFSTGLPYVFTTGAKSTYRFKIFCSTSGNEVFSTQIEKGNTATAFAPYQAVPDNKAAPVKAKKNLLPDFTKWAVSSNGGVKVDENNSYRLWTYGVSGQNNWTHYFVPVSANSTYTFSIQDHNGYAKFQYFDINKTFISQEYAGTSQGFLAVTGTTPNNCFYILIEVSNNLNAGTYTYVNPQLEQGSTATAFETYQALPDNKAAAR